jgi:DNA-binding MarR family transcriptional regulator
VGEVTPYFEFEMQVSDWMATADESERLHVPISCACFNVRKAARAISQLYEDFMQSTGLRPTQYSLLTAIAYVGEEGVGALSEVLSTDRTTLSRNLKPLLEHGWVEPCSGSDRRRRAFRVTEAGRAKLNETIPLWEEAQRFVAEQLGPASIESLRLLADDIASLADRR